MIKSFTLFLIGAASLKATDILPATGCTSVTDKQDIAHTKSSMHHFRSDILQTR